MICYMITSLSLSLSYYLINTRYKLVISTMLAVERQVTDSSSEEECRLELCIPETPNAMSLLYFPPARCPSGQRCFFCSVPNLPKSFAHNRSNSAGNVAMLRISLSHTHTDAQTHKHKESCLRSTPAAQGGNAASSGDAPHTTSRNRRKGRLQAAGERGERGERRSYDTVSVTAASATGRTSEPRRRGFGKKHIYHEREGASRARPPVPSRPVPPPVRGGGRLVAASQSSPPSSSKRCGQAGSLQRAGARRGAERRGFVSRAAAR